MSKKFGKPIVIKNEIKNGYIITKEYRKETKLNYQPKLENKTFSVTKKFKKNPIEIKTIKSTNFFYRDEKWIRLDTKIIHQFYSNNIVENSMLENNEIKPEGEIKLLSETINEQKNNEIKAIEERIKREELTGVLENYGNYISPDKIRLMKKIQQRTKSYIPNKNLLSLENKTTTGPIIEEEEDDESEELKTKRQLLNIFSKMKTGGFDDKEIKEVIIEENDLETINNTIDSIRKKITKTLNEKIRNEKTDNGKKEIEEKIKEFKELIENIETINEKYDEFLEKRKEETKGTGLNYKKAQLKMLINELVKKL